MTPKPRIQEQECESSSERQPSMSAAGARLVGSGVAPAGGSQCVFSMRWKKPKITSRTVTEVGTHSAEVVIRVPLGDPLGQDGD